MAKANYPEKQVAERHATLESDPMPLFRLIARHPQLLDEGSVRAASLLCVQFPRKPVLNVSVR
jgi:hypothetical protein